MKVAVRAAARAAAAEAAEEEASRAAHRAAPSAPQAPQVLQAAPTAPQALHLPPTPADFEAVEQVQRWLSTIKRSTDDIVQQVAAHAFSSFPEDASKALQKRLLETETLCRRTQHALTRCNPRAVAAVEDEKAGGGGRSANGMPLTNLLRDASRATAHFEQVAAAARSCMSQTRQHAAPTTPTTPTKNIWDQLFELPASDDGAPQARSPLRPADAPSTPMGMSSGGGGGGGGGPRLLSASTQQPRRPPSSASRGGGGGLGGSRTPEVPTPPPQLQPPSAALSLWNARTPSAAAAAAPSAAAAACAPSPTGAFETLEADEDRLEAAASEAELTKALGELKHVSERLRAVVAAHVWEGFTEAASSELQDLQLAGREAARTCRRTARKLCEKRSSGSVAALSEAERAIGDYGVALEAAYFTMGQRAAAPGVGEAEGSSSSGSHDGGLDHQQGGTPTATAASPAAIEASSRIAAAARDEHMQTRRADDAPDHTEGEPPSSAPPQPPPPQQQQLVLVPPSSSAATTVASLDEEQRAAMQTNAQVIDEQQAALQAIAQEVNGLNELFSELGHLVASQGEEVETVATLAHETADDVARAREELQIYSEKKECTIQ